MKISQAFFVNESSNKKELIEYDVEPSKVSMLMQQEGIDINSGHLVRVDIPKFNSYDQTFYAGEGSKTVVYYSTKLKRLALLSSEFSQLIFQFNKPVESIGEIKPIVDDALQPNKNWSAFEIMH